jgi:hypothetical protein
MVAGCRVLIAFASVAVLRSLAVRDRRTRVNRAFAAAMSSPAAESASAFTVNGSTAVAAARAAASLPGRSAPVFDAEQAGPADAPAGEAAAP